MNVAFSFRICFFLMLSLPIARGLAATSHIVVDHGSGHVLLSKDADVPRAVASLTKIAAVLVALEWMEETGGALTLSIPVTGASLSGGANPLGLRTGDEVPLETAFFAAMMASDNTSTHAFAEALGRRMDTSVPPGQGIGVFVARMNRLAASIGMSRTRFVNPHGLDGEGEAGSSTAADLARLAIHAHDHPGFGRFCGEKEREVSFRRGGDPVTVRLVNTNELVGSRGIDGTKTGTTSRSGPCLIASSTRDIPVGGIPRPSRLIVVVLDSPERFREAVLLLNEGWTACGNWLAAGGRAGNDCLRKAAN